MTVTADTTTREGVEDSPTPPLTRTQRAGTRTRTRTRTRDGVPTQLGGVDVARARALWRAQPVSLADLWADVRRGDWIPGERPPIIERAGMVYGVAAFALTTTLYAVAWLTQRPGRLTVALAITAAFWVTR